MYAADSAAATNVAVASSHTLVSREIARGRNERGNDDTRKGSMPRDSDRSARAATLAATRKDLTPAPSSKSSTLESNGVQHQALNGITNIHQNDIICGRNGLALKHPGNEAYRNMILKSREPYAICPKSEKLRISKGIVNAIRQINGRFLEREDGKAGSSEDETGDDGRPVTWRDIGDKRAIEKTSQALREGQPKLLEKLGTQKQANSNTNVASQTTNKQRHHPRASTPTKKNNKRQCLLQPQLRQDKVASRVKGGITIEGVGLGLLSKCWGFLSLSDIHSTSLACTKWRDCIWHSAPLWEGLIEQQYPSHRQLPEGWCTSGRKEFFQRMNLMKRQYTPVRNLAGLPIPLQRKTPGAELMQQWNPEAIVIMVDVFSGRHHFDDDVAHYQDDPIEQKKKLGKQVPVYSTCIRVPSVSHADSIDKDDPFPGLTLDKETVCVLEEVQMSSEYREERAAIAALEYFHDATVGNHALNDGLQAVDGLYVEMSYYVEGGGAPKCEPITLLSEHHTFFVNRKDGRMTYRTDVEPAWLPGRYDWDKCESVWNKEEALQRNKVLSRQISKYGSVPLPFDPQVELRLSPPGERSRGHLWGDAFENDSKEKCSVVVEIGFSTGEDDFDCGFANFVVPALLSLWNDAAGRNLRKFA